ncbi:hypothetical protein AK812_SmicGene3800 [Symbiodinium microadriaticum]|uniref:Uncharacterized protein n=1 Tax=Symbiodinium microadriaticum TaxID=2951 RepID=A0A1Q9EY22_SYMMI|nr:hypothetical protein AK812_SmicGene3800 [Symbiodinium microadriaticum]
MIIGMPTDDHVDDRGVADDRQDSWLVLVRDNNDYMEELVQEFKEQKHEIKKMLMINSIEASEFLNSRLLIAATNFTKQLILQHRWFEKMRKLADEFEDLNKNARNPGGLEKAGKATSNHNRRLDAQVELRLSDRQDMETDESAAFEHHKRPRKSDVILAFIFASVVGGLNTCGCVPLKCSSSSTFSNSVCALKHPQAEDDFQLHLDVLLKLHFKQLAMERKKLRAAAKDFNVSSHLLQQVAICRELNALTVNVELNHIWTGVEVAHSELFKQKGRQTAVATSTILAMKDQRAKEKQRALELEQQRAAEEDDDELMNFPPSFVIQGPRNFSVVDVQLVLSSVASV